MHESHNAIDYIRKALLDKEIGLRGPAGDHHEAALIAEGVAQEHVATEWEQTQHIFRIMGRATGREELSTTSEELPTYFTDAFYRLTGHFIVAVGRYHENPWRDEHPTVKPETVIPQLFDDFRVISGLLKYTRTDYEGLNRHPALALNPSETQQLIDEAKSIGFSTSYIKRFTNRMHPFESFETAKDNVIAMREDPRYQAKDSLILKLSATRTNPRAAVEQLEKTVQDLTEIFADNPDVTASDIEHFAHNHSAKNAQSEVEAFVKRVKHFDELYMDDEVIDRNVIRAVCRRSKKPQVLIDRILDRYAEINVKYPAIAGTKLAVYLARNFANPEQVLMTAINEVASDPKLGAKRDRTPYHALWTSVLGKGSSDELSSDSND